MLATLGGALALLLGLAVLLLPLLATELSRPRDAMWGAVVLLLGLVLVTSADRLTGAPMLGVLCGGLLIGRLAIEVAQGRWFRLTPEEQQKLWSAERWQTVLGQLRESVAKLLAIAGGAGALVGGWIAERRQPKSSGKRWVRPEEPANEPPAQPETEPQPATEEAAAPESVATTHPEPQGQPEAERQAQPEAEAAPEPASPEQPAPAEPPATTVIPSLDAVDALLDAAEAKSEEPETPAASDEAR